MVAINININMTNIIIVGNQCSGKSHQLRLLKEDGYNVQHTIDDSSQLTLKYLSDVKRYALSYHLNILRNCLVPLVPSVTSVTSVPSVTPVTPSVHIYDNCPYVLKNVYGQHLFENGHFDVDEFRLFSDYCDKTETNPSILIYLFCHPCVCFDRCQKLNSSVSLDDITKIHVKYEELFSGLDNQYKIYKINGQDTPNYVHTCIKNIIERYEVKV